MIMVIGLSNSDDEVQPCSVVLSCCGIKLLSSDDDGDGLVHYVIMVESIKRRDLILPEIIDYEMPPLETCTKSSENLVPVNDTPLIWPESSSDTEYTSDNNSDSPTSLS